ncbi:hypothetical protein SERLA73DRAFT_178082 [Serpula lacrymans var. lacrymans S7.3]|uniref:J domain-containing protein n=2 Tax=Serpula lacrymans var. lacrymans TaxID=341189 RepID=F8PQI6_SERL3|nr:uncharacterized protein SERLADRAFT_462276 [Serpula lacrymans var. lacrymans S7.9]EGO02234.1 hypothetical protein SERLA73DRAFT_178082 [Serpula lacrymans var. lacrymans S7.3]EGO27952.1 hypothetical protein SERLADRAFT_462276 [Serpula lacrymans var. lacrymans S7.9]
MFRSSLCRISFARATLRYSVKPQIPRLLCLPARNYTQPASSNTLKSAVVTSLPKNCPSCGSPLPTPLPACPKCFYIARLHQSIPYHEVFGFPYDPNPFVVDTSTLKRRFHDAQRVCHPDAWATRDDNLREAALDVSNLINTAYKTLSDPLLRAEYILRRNNVEVEEADQLDDMELISEVMEAREEIDNVQAGESARLFELQDENDAKVQEAINNIKELVQHKRWTEVKTAAVRLKYLQGIRDAIKHRLDNN